MRKSRKRILLCSILALFGIALIALGTSYSLFNMNITKNKNFKVALGNLELTITDNTQGNVFTDGKFIVNNLVPMKESTGIDQPGYKIRLTNTGTIDSTYSMYLDDVILETLPTGITGRIDNSLIRINFTNVTTSESNTYTLNDLTDRLLASGNIEVGSYNDYILRIWLDYSAGNTSQNKYFGAKIRIDGVQENSLCNISASSANNVSMLLSCSRVNKNYTTINQVLSDTTAVQKIANSTSGIDYLALSKSWANAVTANETAMTYIGNNDYAADTLLADSTWLNAIANSTYFEKVLNVKVPTMTSNTTPSGTCIASGYFEDYQIYNAFDNDSSTAWSDRVSPYTVTETNRWIGYEFTTSVNVRKAKIIISNAMGEAGTANLERYDGTNWIRVASVSYTGNQDNYVPNLTIISTDSSYATKYRVFIPHRTVANQSNNTAGATVTTLQFYGRAASE